MKEELNLMIQMLSDTIGTRAVDALGFLLAFALTALMDSVFRERLPHDHGRAFAVNGELSKGKARGSGLIFVLCIALVTLAVVPLRAEYLIYTALLIASMLSGYFDDAAEAAWNEYKKGPHRPCHRHCGGCDLPELQQHHRELFAVELRHPVSALPRAHRRPHLGQHQRRQLHRRCGRPVGQPGGGVSIGTFLLAYRRGTGRLQPPPPSSSSAHCWPTCGSNAKPSTLLMGDAGSRAMGFFLAVLALKSNHPFAFLLAALVFIVDGSLGILKISFKRFLHISILKKTLTPLHDHVRKRMGWSDEQVVARWLSITCRRWHRHFCCCWPAE